LKVALKVTERHSLTKLEAFSEAHFISEVCMNKPRGRGGAMVREAGGSEIDQGAAPGVHGVAEIAFARRSGGTRLVHLYQRDPLRVLFPMSEAGEPPQAAIVTTSGGLVAGDRLEVVVGVGDGAAAHVTASAAEKIYRSLGATTKVTQSLAVGDGAALEFLPLETILFDGARLDRKIVVDLASTAAFLGGGIVVFGRRARGERFMHGFLHDVWEVRREGSLVWGDALHLDGDIAAIIDHPACFDRAAGFAMLILGLAGSDPRKFIDGARVVQTAAMVGLRAGLTLIGGLLVARWLGNDAMLLRRAYADLACHLRAEAMGLPRRMPRIWHV
jgi:urease accessory protein